MTHLITRSTVRRATLGAVLLVAVACRNPDVASPPGLDIEGIVPVGTLMPIVLREDGARPGESILTVRVHGMGIEVGAYQGVLTFDTTAVTFISIETPQVEGEFRIVNETDAASGRLRFAAFTAERLSSDVAFRVTVRHSGSWESAAVRARLDVAGDATGAAIAESVLRASSAMYDAHTGASITP